MVAKTANSVDMERAELQSVLESELFQRAPTLAHLLSYLCEKSFAGESAQIKEYSVGIDVFHRGPDFDQDSDSIVRVQANRLRKRLAEYYAGPGAAHSLKITIPIGQYVPLFEFVASTNAESQEHVLQEAPVPTPTPSPAWRRLGRKPWLWAGCGGAILMIALATFVWVGQRSKQQPSAVDRANAPSVAAEPIGLPIGDELRILAGAGRSYVDHAGKLWTADTYFSGGVAVKSEVQHIWRTQDPSFYRTSRQGQFRYDLPLKKGVYELRLHFAETFYGPENIGSGGEGSRMITVLANGKPLLTNFDVLADGGGGGTADVKVFTDISPAADGRLHLEFASSDGGNAMLSAIEVLPGVHGQIRPIRVLARQTPYYSNDSHWWSPDEYFKGGQIGDRLRAGSRHRRPGAIRDAPLGKFLVRAPRHSGKVPHRALLLGTADPSKGGCP